MQMLLGPGGGVGQACCLPKCEMSIVAYTDLVGSNGLVPAGKIIERAANYRR